MKAANTIMAELAHFAEVKALTGKLEVELELSQAGMSLVNHVLEKKKDFDSIEQIAAVCVDNINTSISVKLTDKFDQQRPKPSKEKSKHPEQETISMVRPDADLTSDIMAKIGFKVGDSVVHKDAKTCKMKITNFAMA